MSNRKRVLVLGDLIIDEFYRAESMGVSPAEKAVTGKYDPSIGYQRFFGGAGLVARHLLRLSCHVDQIAFCARDDKLDIMEFTDAPDKHEWERYASLFLRVKGWVTTTKRRYYIDDEKVLKLNTINTYSLSDDDRERFTTIIHALQQRNYTAWDCVVICDNGHGALDEELAKWLIKDFRDKGVEVSVCCQGSYASPDYSKYDGCDWVFMNEKEWQDSCETFSAPSGNLIVTLGDRGAEALVDHKHTHFSAKKIEAKDTLGAGDAFMAAFVSCPSRDLTTRLDFANEWAARACMEEGTRVPR